jgi:hypothetical protein
MKRRHRRLFGLLAHGRPAGQAGKRLLTVPMQTKASQRASFHVEAALRLARRGLEIARTDADRHALMCMIGGLQHHLGDISASITTYREAVTAATNDAARCRAWLGLPTVSASVRADRGS